MTRSSAPHTVFQGTREQGLLPVCDVQARLDGPVTFQLAATRTATAQAALVDVGRWFF